MSRSPSVCLVIPVLNEERQIVTSVRRTREVLNRLSHWRWDLVVVDNGSNDRTWELAESLAGQGMIRVLRLARRGRGRALRAAWMSSEADVLAYMDVDLSTDLSHLADLLEPLAGGVADLTLGSRWHPGSAVLRGWCRGFLSRNYNCLARWLTGSVIRDHQCGFKALTHGAARTLVPQVENDHWFFDTELLVLAQRGGWRVREFPVHWTEGRDSRVRLVSTMVEEFRGLWRLRRRWRSSESWMANGRGPGEPEREG
jgi:glycosyltransferase involved in cell wall biosynthesis